MRKWVALLLFITLVGCGGLGAKQHGDFVDDTPALASEVNDQINDVYDWGQQITSTPVGINDTQTLTNKTLTSPTIASPTITTSPTAAGATWTDLGTITTAAFTAISNLGTVATAAFTTITNLGTVTTADINGGTIDGTIIGGTSAAAGTFTTMTATDISSAAIPPIGSIIPFYDYNGVLTFNASFWAYCDGSTATLTGIGLQTLPDLSGRYLVGFGTDGGGDIDTSAWATAAVGNASHQVALNHTHTGPSHTHTGPSHTHSPGTLQFAVANFPSAGVIEFWDLSGNVRARLSGNAVQGPGTGIDRFYWSVWEGSPLFAWTKNSESTGSTGASGTAATGASGTEATGSSLSATQSIQPRSVRIRYLMRIR